jgi:hypothetical protein
MGHLKCKERCLYDWLIHDRIPLDLFISILANHCRAKKMVAVDGFESSAVFSQIHTALSASQADKESAMKKVKAVFQFEVKVS